jgi:hypothetical protein
VIALRAPLYLAPGIATALTAGLWLAQPAPPRASAPVLAVEPAPEPVGVRASSTETACDADAITAIVIRGQFTSLEHIHEGFAISFAGTNGRYTAFTDPRGYFEVRIPREDVAIDLCRLPADARRFSDDQMTLSYRLDFE